MVLEGKNMMYELAKQYFDKFVKDNFNLNDEKISHKMNHAYQVLLM